MGLASFNRMRREQNIIMEAFEDSTLEPLKKLGITISAEQLEAYAVENKIEKTKEDNKIIKKKAGTK